MSDIASKIARVEAQLEASREKTENLESELWHLMEQQQRELGEKYGLQKGDRYRLSNDLRADLATRNWWTGLRHGGYDPFTINAISYDGKSVYITDSMGGTTGVPYELAVACEKVK